MSDAKTSRARRTGDETRTEATIAAAQAVGAKAAATVRAKTRRTTGATTTANDPSYAAPDTLDGNVAFGEVASAWNKDGFDQEPPVAHERVARPFIKWAGGKRALIGEIDKRLPARIPNYFEPFVGGGAVFFALAERIEGRAVLVDSVPELVITYRVVRDRVEDLIDALDVLALAHRADDEAGVTGKLHHYYKIRDTGIPELDNELAVAARFVYLNRTCFNGLYRVNAKGRFNVPMGRYKDPRIVDAAGLRAAARALAKAEIICADFDVIGATPVTPALEVTESLDMSSVKVPDGEPLVFDGADELIAYLESIDEEGDEFVSEGLADPEAVAMPALPSRTAEPGDFVYFDPPYIPLIKTSFTSYTNPHFGLSDQERLRDLIVRLTGAGVFVMASNSSAPEARTLYDDPRLRLDDVEAPRRVNSKVEGREPVTEILVTNYEPGAVVVGVTVDAAMPESDE